MPRKTAVCTWARRAQRAEAKNVLDGNGKSDQPEIGIKR